MKQRDEIRGPLDEIAALTAGRLSAAGWTRQWFDDTALAAFMQPTQDDVLAAVEVRRLHNGTWDDLPVKLGVSVGVGYGPALDLCPLLTLEPELLLVGERDGGREARLVLPFATLEELDDVARTVGRIMQFVDERAPAVIEAFPDADSIAASLSGDEVGDESPRHPGQRRLVLLTALGREREARALLASYEPDQDDEDDVRFVRQLTRWLDSGCPTPPPLEDTLRLLPQRREQPRVTRSEQHARERDRKEAAAAVRSQSQGKSLSELRELIEREHSRRDLEISPSATEMLVELLHVEQQPFGRLRSTLHGARLVGTGIAEVAGTFRSLKDAFGDTRPGPAPPAPDWVRLPERASYPVAASQERFAAVDLDETAADLIERVRAHTGIRWGRRTRVDVWLTRTEPAETLAVHIGERRIGSVRTRDVLAYDAVMRAAALFDEDPYLHGYLVGALDGGIGFMEIPLPDSPTV